MVKENRGGKRVGAGRKISLNKRDKLISIKCTLNERNHLTAILNAIKRQSKQKTLSETLELVLSSYMKSVKNKGVKWKK